MPSAPARLHTPPAPPAQFTGPPDRGLKFRAVVGQGPGPVSGTAPPASDGGPHRLPVMEYAPQTRGETIKWPL